jgi:hypothetical protein
MKSESVKEFTVPQASETLGLVRRARVWHLQDQDVGAVFLDATLSKKGSPDLVLMEARRKNLALARENARLAAESKEQSEEITQLMDMVSEYQRKLAQKEAEIAETTLRRSELQPFWALATPEARLLLVTIYLTGPVDIYEIVRQADNPVEVLEAICRLRMVGFIKFQACRICVTVPGEEFAKRLGFMRQR